MESTASVELREKLELCRDLMSHANPSRDLAVVIERSVELLLTDLERTCLRRTKRPPASSSDRDTEAPSNVTSATRRTVFERDGLRCTYVSPDGRRCHAHAFLELDHRTPRALGGSSDSENLRVLCRAHNQLAAEQVFGRETIERARHFGRPKRQDPPSSDASRKVQTALTGLGFAPARARDAIAEVHRLHPTGLPSIEETLREAILVATRSCEKPRRVA